MVKTVIRHLANSLDRVATSNWSWSCPGRSSSPSGESSSCLRPRCPGAFGPARRTLGEGSYSSFDTPESWCSCKSEPKPLKTKVAWIRNRGAWSSKSCVNIPAAAKREVSQRYTDIFSLLLRTSFSCHSALEFGIVLAKLWIRNWPQNAFVSCRQQIYGRSSRTLRGRHFSAAGWCLRAMVAARDPRHLPLAVPVVNWEGNHLIEITKTSII